MTKEPGSSPDLPDLPAALAEAVDALRVRLAAAEAVHFAYLYGSVAKGHAREGSDIDVGVHLPEGWTRSARLDHALSLEGALERRAGRPVQVTVLNDAPLELRANVLSHGLLLHERDGAARRRFFVDTARAYHDMAPAREIFRRYQARRIREGTFGG